MFRDQPPRRDKDGKRWHFSIWYEVWTDDKVRVAQRVFFWDDKKETCGVALFPPGFNQHLSRLKKLIEKLIADPQLRKQYERSLKFPLDRYYSEYGSFPEEKH